jgi:hypothetical protein
MVTKTAAEVRTHILSVPEKRTVPAPLSCPTAASPFQLFQDGENAFFLVIKATQQDQDHGHLPNIAKKFVAKSCSFTCTPQVREKHSFLEVNTRS